MFIHAYAYDPECLILKCMQGVLKKEQIFGWDK